MGSPLVSPYEQWIQDEGVPIVHDYAVADVMALELRPWERLGGQGAYVQLVGMEGLTGMHVVEIPPAVALAPEKHMYDKLLYVLSGRGVTTLWSGSRDKPDHPPSLFEWHAGSLFAPPLNTWHHLSNGSGTEPARILAVTTAPLIIDMYRNLDFVFNCDFRFTDRYDGAADYFTVGGRSPRPDGHGMMWETNFIPDVRTSLVDAQDERGPEIGTTQFEMSGNVLAGHIAAWPVARYHKAHYHGGGAIILIIAGQGYTLMWPQEWGTRPYESGYGDKVIRSDWQAGSLLCPPTGWFHQHFNTGRDPARQLALRYGSKKYAVRFHDIQQREGAIVSTRQGGTMIEFEDEDPEIPRQYREALAAIGIPYPPAVAV
jgi:quercetin dioxygenase-like cupin family protein